MNTTTRLLYSLIVVLVSGFIESGSTIGEQPFVDECIQLDDNAPCPLNSSLLSFYLFTRDTQDEPFILNLDNIRDAPFKSYIPLKVLVHGYTGWKDYAPNEELRPAYFEYGDYNILSLDWGPLANESCYLEATYNVKPVGVCAAQMLEEIVAQRDDIPAENIHVIGFSLGAHAAGNIGRSLKTFTLERLTVLDPAFPFFDDIFNSKYSVNKNDSLFVDAIHTNAGMKGKINAVGHVDFYMNNAAVQPGCSSSDTSCSHHRAVEYFAETISTQVGFWGYPCTSFWYYLIGVCTPPPTDQWVLMGEHIKRTELGVYFVQTNDKPPYAIGKNVIELDSRALAEQSSYYGIEYLNDNTIGLPGMSDDVQN